VPSSGIATDKKEEGSVQERRPSWRLRVDNGDRSKVCPSVCLQSLSAMTWLFQALAATVSMHLTFSFKFVLLHSARHSAGCNSYLCFCLILSSLLCNSFQTSVDVIHHKRFISKHRSHLVLFVHLLQCSTVHSLRTSLFFFICSS
jgi:hypothetical protein